MEMGSLRCDRRGRWNMIPRLIASRRSIALFGLLIGEYEKASGCLKDSNTREDGSIYPHEKASSLHISKHNIPSVGILTRNFGLADEKKVDPN